MKKIFVIISIFIFTFLLTGCSKTKNNKYILTEKEENKIIDAYCKKYNEAIGEDQCYNDYFTLSGYYGQYNGGYVVAYPGNEGPMFDIKYPVGEYTFEFSGTHILQMFYKNKIYNLDDAYNKGLLSNKDIGMIYRKYQEVGGIYAIGRYPEDFELYRFHWGIICCDEVEGIMFLYPQISSVLVLINNEYILYSYEEIMNKYPDFNINKYIK
jgi:hypothetical protein